jgi:hypothetical protein
MFTEKVISATPFSTRDDVTAASCDAAAGSTPKLGGPVNVWHTAAVEIGSVLRRLLFAVGAKHATMVPVMPLSASPMAAYLSFGKDRVTDSELRDSTT